MVIMLNKKIKSVLILTASIVIFLSIAAVAKAATGVYFNSTTENIQVGDNFAVDFKISSPDESINVIDGSILYDKDKLEIKDVITSQSLFSLWQKTPTFDNNQGRLSFVGGTTTGFEGAEGQVFKIIFLAKKSGQAKVDFQDVLKVYLNDGQGSKQNPWLKPMTIAISEKSDALPAKDIWPSLVAGDKISPEPFTIILSKDPNIFANKYFISFSAVDKESGIDHYEVSEDGGKYLEATSPYLLKDQNLKNTITVKAVDKAGNERISTINSKANNFSNNWLLVLSIILLAIAVIVIIKYRKKAV